MSESIKISESATKVEKYKELLPQLRSLMKGEISIIANMANVSAVLKETFGWWWVGFYTITDDELVLGPFQGTIACTRIGYGKGVCGSAWKNKESILVPDVEKFPGHIACSSRSKSEIVIPIFNSENDVVAILDVDSENYTTLDEADVYWLEKVAELFSEMY